MKTTIKYGCIGLSMLTGGQLAAKPVAKVKVPEKPNLLFIWTDQQVDKTMAVYGNSIFEVPNMNALAEECIVFANNRVVQPVSTPSRGSIMTGLYPHKHGACKNNLPLNESAKTVPEIMNDSSYATGYFGKWHLGDEVFAQHGFQEFESVEDNYINYYSPGRDRNARCGYFKFLVENGLTPDNTKDGMFSRKYVSSLPYELGKPKYLETVAVDFMTRHKDQPFVLYINYLEPHTPFNGPFNELHDREALPVSPSLDVPLGDDDPQRYKLKQVKKWTLDDFKEAKQHYAGLCNAVDRSLGNILRCLDSLGLRDNTIVVFTSDHGEMMGAHHLMHKSVMYEEALRVPLMMRIPWINGNEQKIIARNVSSIDITPTVLELLKAPRPETLQGRSLLPLIQGRKRAGDDGYTYCVWNSGNDEDPSPKVAKGSSSRQARASENASFRTVISPDGWKLTLSDTDKHQLFNLNNDPYECYNLYYSGKYADLIKKMEAKLKEWQKRTDDGMKWTL